jgi:hypothetical protein
MFPAIPAKLVKIAFGLPLTIAALSSMLRRAQSAPRSSVTTTSTPALSKLRMKPLRQRPPRGSVQFLQSFLVRKLWLEEKRAL